MSSPSSLNEPNWVRDGGLSRGCRSRRMDGWMDGRVSVRRFRSRGDESVVVKLQKTKGIINLFTLASNQLDSDGSVLGIMDLKSSALRRQRKFHQCIKMAGAERASITLSLSRIGIAFQMCP